MARLAILFAAAVAAVAALGLGLVWKMGDAPEIAREYPVQMAILMFTITWCVVMGSLGMLATALRVLDPPQKRRSPPHDLDR